MASVFENSRLGARHLFHAGGRRPRNAAPHEYRRALNLCFAPLLNSAGRTKQVISESAAFWMRTSELVLSVLAALTDVQLECSLEENVLAFYAELRAAIQARLPVLPFLAGRQISFIPNLSRIGIAIHNLCPSSSTLPSLLITFSPFSTSLSYN